MDGVELEKRIEHDIGRSKLHRNRNNLKFLWRIGIIVLPFISAIITVAAAIVPGSQAQQPHDTMWSVLAAIASVVTAMFVPSLLKEYENAQRLVTTSQTCLMTLEKPVDDSAARYGS
jgi:energy-coupling factor transporter transmembrane protein EcfT